MANIWTTIPDSDVDPESPITTALMQALRDNPEGIAGAATGAPKVKWASMEKPLVLHTNVTPVGNVGTGEDDLMSYTLPANTLATNGDRLRITAVFIGNAADNVALKFHFGTFNVIIMTGSVISAIPGLGMLVVGEVIRYGANNQDMNGFARNAGVLLNAPWDQATQNLAAVVTIKFTGENLTDASNDAIIQRYMQVEHLPA